MGFLRDRGEPAGTRYPVREKLFAIGDDFWIENEAGERAYKVNGKALRVRETLVLENPSGDELAKIQERKLRVRDTMKVEQGGSTVATVSRLGHQNASIRPRVNRNAPAVPSSTIAM
jgi:uncharacterized protein YxjI